MRTSVARTLAATSVAAAGLGGLTFVLPAQATGPYQLVSLSASVTGSSVTAQTTVSAATTTTASAFGVCARSSSGQNVDFWKRAATISPRGTTSVADTKTFPDGTYQYFPCLFADGFWSNVGSPKWFRVGGPTPTPTPTSGPTVAPTPTPTTTRPPPTSGPAGPPGSWSLAFSDEFNGTSLDRSRWSPMDGGHMNNVTTSAANVSESGGNLVLTLASSTSGAAVSSAAVDGAGAHHFEFPVGDYAEARVLFPGSGTTIYNWPAWWVSGPSWPSAGEHDIAEGLGTLTVNYHSPSGSHNQGTIPGNWAGSFHTYGVYRHAGSADVYWDGQLVKHYAADDNGQAESLLFNVGQGNTQVYGAGSQVKVDWVRVWH